MKATYVQQQYNTYNKTKKKESRDRVEEIKSKVMNHSSKEKSPLKMMPDDNSCSPMAKRVTGQCRLHCIVFVLLMFITVWRCAVEGALNGFACGNQQWKVVHTDRQEMFRKMQDWLYSWQNDCRKGGYEGMQVKYGMVSFVVVGGWTVCCTAVLYCKSLK